MSDITRILAAIEEGGPPHSTDELLPVVYDELRRLASRRMADESPGDTLQPTALVHEVFVRLVDVERARHWRSREHFFAAAAEAMRRVLIDRARGRQRLKRGGDRRRLDLDAVDAAATAGLDDLLAIDEALAELDRTDPLAARLTRIHWYAGVPVEQAGDMLGLSRTTAYEVWKFARAFLRVALE